MWNSPLSFIDFIHDEKLADAQNMKNSLNQQITQIIGAIHKQYSIEIVGSISVKNGKSVHTAEYTHKKGDWS